MKSFLVLATVTVLSLNSVHAGIVPVGPNEESQLLNLFDRVCGGGGGYSGGYSGGYGGGDSGFGLGGGGGDGQDVGGALVYCKLATGGRREPLQHRVTAPGSRGQDQIVFVRPAPVQYDHNILVEGGQSLGGKTRIYVLPNHATHTVTPNVVPGSSSGQKPSVTYLSGNSGSHVNGATPLSSYGPPQRGYATPDIKTPSVSYGSPTPNLSYGSPDIVRTPSVSYGSPEINLNTAYGAPQRLHKRSDGYIQYPTYVSSA